MDPISSSKIRQFSRFGQRAVYGLSLLEAAKANDSIFAISADLGNSSGLERFSKTLPSRFCNIGIAEQHMMGFAAGLSTTGFSCFVSSFAPFITMRACEQVRLNLGYMKSNVKIVSIGSGISMGYLGNSHFGIEDLGIIKSIPNIPILCPADTSQVYECVRYLSSYEGPAYLRLTGAANSPSVYAESVPCTFSSSDTLRVGEDLLVLSHGSVVANCASAIDQIHKDYGICIHLENVYGLHPLPPNLSALISQFTRVVVVEEHRRTGGLYSSIAQLCVDKKMSASISSVTLPDSFLTSGDYDYLIDHYGLSSSKLYSSLLTAANT